MSISLPAAVRTTRLTDWTTMARERRHYPVTIYPLAVLAALGLVSVVVGLADGWVPIAGGVPAVVVSLARLHVILHRRRAVVAASPPRRIAPL